MISYLKYAMSQSKMLDANWHLGGIGAVRRRMLVMITLAARKRDLHKLLRAWNACTKRALECV